MKFLKKVFGWFRIAKNPAKVFAEEPGRFICQKSREFIGLKSPCLKYREVAKEMVEAAREGQEKTYQVKRPTIDVDG